MLDGEALNHPLIVPRPGVRNMWRLREFVEVRRDRRALAIFGALDRGGLPGGIDLNTHACRPKYAAERMAAAEIAKTVPR